MDRFWKPRPAGLPSASRAHPEGSPADRAHEPAAESFRAPSTEDRKARLQRSVGNQALQRLHSEAQGRDSSERSRSGAESRQRTTAEAALAALGPGRPLDATRARRVAGPGVDLAAVRLHDDATAARLTAEHGARAFTVGDHIAFAPGQLQPGTLAGDALLAHELAHVEQQRRGTGRGDDVSEASLEADADRSAAGHLLSRLAGAGRRVGASLASGLRLQGCFLVDGDRPIEEQFENQSTGVLGDLDTEQTDRIQAAVDEVAGDNPHLRRAFYEYFAEHEINLYSGGDLDEAREAGRYAETTGGSDMTVDPRILESGFNRLTLGTLMFHELVHTRHPSMNVMGMGDFYEGDAYAVEYFLAQRAGAEERSAEIREIMGAHMYGQDDYRQAWRARFRDTYGTIRILQRRADGEDLPEGAPSALADMSQEDAQREIANLLVQQEEDRSQNLQDLIQWVRDHHSDLDLPL